MIVDAKKMARSAGRFLTRRAEVGAGRLGYVANKYRELDEASGGVVSTVLSGTPIPQMVSTIYNPLAGSINAMNALGKGLTTLGNMDYKRINYKAAGQGIQDLKQAYDFGSAVFRA